MSGGARGQREVVWLAWGKTVSLWFFYPKIGIFLGSPEKIDVFNWDFIS